MTRLVVVGFGLIGASVAAGARSRRLVRHVTAVDRAEVLGDDTTEALSDERVDVSDRAAVHAALARCDLAVMAAPVGQILEDVAFVLDAAPIVTDCGSTKRAVAQAAASSHRQRHFVPGHPLAGAPRGGVRSARADLFEGRAWVICPEQAGTAAIDAVTGLITGLGAQPVSMTPAEHDRAVALTSHVPQLFASALVVLSERRGSRVAEGTGFASATRVAGGSPEMWHDILLTNADEVAAALRELSSELDAIAAELSRSPPELEAALELLRDAREARS